MGLLKWIRNIGNPPASGRCRVCGLHDTTANMRSWQEGDGWEDPRVWVHQHQGSCPATRIEAVPCATCNGTGKRFQGGAQAYWACQRCRGTGKREVVRPA